MEWTSVTTAVTNRFNRYMVECESFINHFLQVFQLVLIDTWWNVNTSEGSYPQTEGLVLIDTWWNVNLKRYVVVFVATSF